VPTPTAATQIKFDGSETINVQFTDGGLNYNATFAPTGYKGSANTTFTGASNAIATPISTWQASINLFQVIGLQTGAPTIQSPVYSKYARLTQWTYTPGSQANTVGFQIVGDTTPTASMPTTGAAQYVGQAYGQTANLIGTQTSTSGPFGTVQPNGTTQNFTATSIWNVNFAKSSLTGAITDFHIGSGGDPYLQKSAIGFTASLTGSSFTGQGTLYGLGLNSGSATVAGNFYGPATSPAAEIGGTFSGPSIVGGFVGAPVSPATTTAFPITWSITAPTVSYQADQFGTNPAAYTFALSQPTVTISDPDGSTTVSPVNLSGDETVLGIGLGEANHGSATQQMTLATGSGTRNLSSQSWGISQPSENCCSESLTLYKLLVGQRPTSGSLDGNPAAQYVQFYSFDSGGSEINASYSFGLFGVMTPTASMPTTGTATFNGEAYGRYFPWNSSVSAISASYTAFNAAAQVNVDFSKTTGAVTGTIGTLACPNACSGVPTLSIGFTGNLSGSQYSGAATASGVAMTGNVSGGFYGPASAPAKETGGVFLLTGTGAGALTGGFVAGR
jgi:hypothetical protein